MRNNVNILFDALKESHGLTQADVAAGINPPVSQKAVSNALRGTSTFDDTNLLGRIYDFLQTYTGPVNGDET